MYKMMGPALGARPGKPYVFFGTDKPQSEFCSPDVQKKHKHDVGNMYVYILLVYFLWGGP